MVKSRKEIKAEIEIPEGITIDLDENILKVKGKGGEVIKKLFNPNVKISKDSNKIILNALKFT